MNLLPKIPDARPLVSRSETTVLESNHYQLGEIIGRGSPFEISEDQLATHSCVLGATGSGKSKLLELLMRYLMVARQGFALIDPHGDLSEDLLAYAGYRKLAKKETDIAKRIHYLEPSFDHVFCFDPFRFNPTRPIPVEMRANAYSAWLRAKADRVAEVFQRKQSQSGFEGMPRLQRVLTDVLVAAGTNVGGEPAEHLSVGDAQVLLDFSNKARHAEVYGRIRPFLEPEIAADFDRLVACKNDDQRLRETESTINRLRSLFSPIVKAIFSAQAESIDLRSIIQNGDILLLNLRETDYFSADQQSSIGGLFIQELLSTARNAARDNRNTFHLIIDEAANFIGEDIREALGEMRKFRMPVCLAAQDLSSFKKGELDLRPKVLSQCGTKICFEQTWPEDLDLLSRVLGTGNLDFTKHYQVVDRHDGYDWVEVDETGESTSTGITHGTSEGRTTSHTKGSSNTSSSSQTFNMSTTDSTSHTGSHSSARSTGGSSGPSGGHDTHSRSKSVSQTDGMSTTHGTSETRGQSSMSGSSQAESQSSNQGETTGRSESKSETQGKSVSHKKVHLARYREELHESPQLRMAVSDQIEWIKKALHGLGTREALVKLKGRPDAVLMKTDLVEEKWNKKDKVTAVERMKELCRQKPYFSVPDFSPQSAEARASEFAAGGSSPAAKSLEKAEKTPFL